MVPPQVATGLIVSPLGLGDGDGEVVEEVVIIELLEVEELEAEEQVPKPGWQPVPQ